MIEHYIIVILVLALVGVGLAWLNARDWAGYYERKYRALHAIERELWRGTEQLKGEWEFLKEEWADFRRREDEHAKREERAYADRREATERMRRGVTA